MHASVNGNTLKRVIEEIITPCRSIEAEVKLDGGYGKADQI